MGRYIPQHLFSHSKYTMMLLNTEVKLDTGFFTRVWNKAVIRHTVDGGSNHFHTILERTSQSQDPVKLKPPEITSGDFDSIKPNVMEYLRKEKSTKIVLTDDQNETDFTKGLKVLKEHVESEKLIIENIIVISELSGRLDQLFANLNTLYKIPFSSDPEVNVYLLSSTCISWLLPLGKNTIEFKSGQGMKCGIIPLNGPVKIRSTGLKWELNEEDECSMNGLISTSNQIARDEVVIEALENPVLFTFECHSTDYEMPSEF